MLEDARGAGEKSGVVAREEKDRVSVVLQQARAKGNTRAKRAAGGWLDRCFGSWGQAGSTGKSKLCAFVR